MDSKIRAEKMLPQLKWFVENNENGFPYLLAQIEEAEREAVVTNPVIQRLKKEPYAEGFRAAREKAKGIVEAHRWDRDKVSTVAVIDLITQRIGELEP